MLLAVPIPLVGYFQGHGFPVDRSTAALLIVGLTLLLWPYAGKQTVSATEPTARPYPGSAAITALGYDINLAVIQVMALATMIISAVRASIDVAWWASLICAALTIPLFRTRARIVAMIVGATGLIYFVYLLSIWDIGYIIASSQYARLHYHTYFGIYLDLRSDEIAWIIMAIAAIPHVQGLRLGTFGLGRLRGDFHVRSFGSDIPVALGSAILLAAAHETFWILWYAPRALPVMLSLSSG